MIVNLMNNNREDFSSIVDADLGDHGYGVEDNLVLFHVVHGDTMMKVL